MKKSIGEMVVTVVASAATIGLGALLVDWLKSTGRWPHVKTLDAGCDTGCMNGEDPVINAGKDLIGGKG